MLPNRMAMMLLIERKWPIKLDLSKRVGDKTEPDYQQ